MGLIKWIKGRESKFHTRLVILGYGFDVLYTTYFELTWWQEDHDVCHSWSSKFGYEKF